MSVTEHLNNYHKSALGRYSLALLSVAIALMMRIAMQPLYGEENPYRSMWLAVVYCAWFCGVGPSILAIITGVIGVWYFILEPEFVFSRLDSRQLLGAAGFVVFALAIVALGEANRRSIAKRLAVEEELIRSEQQFRDLANSIPELCWMAHPDGYRFWYNERWHQFTGTTPDQVGTIDWTRFHHPDHLPITMTRWQHAIRNGEEMESEFPLRGADGQYHWFLSRMRPLRDRSGKVVRWFGTNTNIDKQRQAMEQLAAAGEQAKKLVQARTAELKIANDGLRELAGHLMRVQDDERRNIARELHDSVGQLLTVLSINLATVDRESEKLNPETARLIPENAELVQQISREVRTLSHLLHPPLLEEAGLASALSWYVDGFSERSGIAAAVDIPDNLPRLSGAAELAIFRIVQEGLTNIHRHSGSETASIRLCEEQDTVILEIRDEGKGIPLEKLQELASFGRMGVGFRGMRERLLQLDGILEVTSNAEGTVVMARIPKTAGAK